MTVRTYEDVKALLDAPLRRDVIKERDGLSYLEGWHVINEANRIFGYGSWGGTIVRLEHLGDVPVVSRQGKEGFKTAYLCEYRVTVKIPDPYSKDIEGNPQYNYVTFSDVGFGNAVSYQGNALDNHELAAKEAATDAMKRCLRAFGNQFGNALYDKEQRNVEKEKVEVTLTLVTNTFKNLPKAKRDELKDVIPVKLKELGVESGKLGDAQGEALEAIYEYQLEA